MECAISSTLPVQKEQSSNTSYAAPRVARRPCGRNGLTLPVLGMGCWAYGGGEYWGAQSQQDVEAVVRCGMERGCNFFDTAESYNDGASERALGQALQGIPRDKVLICTKISPSNVEPHNMAKHLEASLQRLQTDYVDLYMVHWPITAHSIQHFTSGKNARALGAGCFCGLGKGAAGGQDTAHWREQFWRDKNHGGACDQASRLSSTNCPTAC